MDNEQVLRVLSKVRKVYPNLRLNTDLAKTIAQAALDVAREEVRNEQNNIGNKHDG